MFLIKKQPEEIRLDCLIHKLIYINKSNLLHWDLHLCDSVQLGFPPGSISAYRDVTIV